MRNYVGLLITELSQGEISPSDRRGFTSPRWIGAGIASAVLALTACHSRSQPQTGPIERVVTLTPTATEVISAVGAAQMLVGVDRFSNYPVQVRALPKVGEYVRTDIEAVIRLKPDLVVLDQVQQGLVATLKRWGIRSIVLDSHTIEDVKDALVKVGRALDREPAAASAVRAIDDAIEAARTRTRTRSQPRPRVVALIEREPGSLGRMVAAGPGSYLDELLAIVGVENAIASTNTRYPTISAEDIVRANPTAILDAVQASQFEAAKQDWLRLGGVEAVIGDRIYPFASELYASPNPRIVAALTALEQLLYSKSPR